MKVRQETVAESVPPAENQQPATTADYVHLPINEDVLAFAGYYTPEQEVRLPFHGRELLYVTGHIVVESACHGGTCEPQNYWYALVPGYVVVWQYRKNESDLPVSKVESIPDLETRKEIEQLIFSTEAVSRVEFH
jgi:hypothetical protein